MGIRVYEVFEAESLSDGTTGAKSWKRGKTRVVMESTAEDWLELLERPKVLEVLVVQTKKSLQAIIYSPKVEY